MKTKPQNFNYSDFEAVKNIALTFPGTEESTSHEGTPSVKMRGKLMCRLHDSGEFIPIRLDFEFRDRYLKTYPEIFIYLTILKITLTSVCGFIITITN
ncbi:hypothetical protein ASG31_08035 [Chryseobacterium sp. Leaf404]|uniref:hypothetical protein n=1 Tax=unclassified Chryseobacterium TaxID=2593645 RepID=UPI0006FD939B|nr:MULTISPECIES: hypothetical protein [unclassified Chryseobacterium]KQT17352.1 hypothetical protein ASG31_08035 [Chryseobacterium sp. Leaf404]